MIKDEVHARVRLVPPEEFLPTFQFTQLRTESQDKAGSLFDGQIDVPGAHGWLQVL